VTVLRSTLRSVVLVAFAAASGCNSPNDHPEGTKPATAAPAQPAPAAPNAMTVYVDPAQRFRFEHPAELVVVTGSAEPAPDWRAETTTNGRLLAQVVIPREAQPGTNFAGAKLTLGKSADPAAARDCTRDAPGEQARAATTLTLHGRTFAQIVFSEAGAGNFYDTTSYRTVDKGECFAVEYTIHSTNLANYSPDQGIQAFDRAKVSAELEAMVRSFELL
jgi:hypothetical protein